MFTEPSSTNNINVNIGNKVFKITSNTDDKETNYSWDNKFLDLEIRNYFGKQNYGVKDMSKLLNALHKYDQANVNNAQNDFSTEEFQAVIDEASKNNAEDLGLAKINYQDKILKVNGHGNYLPDWKQEEGGDDKQIGRNYDAGKWNNSSLGNYRYLPTIEEIKTIVDLDKSNEILKAANDLAKTLQKRGECYGGFKIFMKKVYPNLEFRGSRGYAAAVTLENHTGLVDHPKSELFAEIYVAPEDIQKLSGITYILTYDDANGRALEDSKGTTCGHICVTTSQNSIPFELLKNPTGQEYSSMSGPITNPNGSFGLKNYGGRYRVFVPIKQTLPTETPQTIAQSENISKNG